MLTKLYGVIDAARDRKLYELIKSTPDHACLFAGELRSPLERTAPYLIDLTSGLDFLQIWRRHWGESWGIIALSSVPMSDLRRHFRRFLQAKLPNGEVALFRFYDPRVFLNYFRNCAEDQKSEWFECISEFRVEAAQGSGTIIFRAAKHG